MASRGDIVGLLEEQAKRMDISPTTPSEEEVCTGCDNIQIVSARKGGLCYVCGTYIRPCNFCSGYIARECTVCPYPELDRRIIG